MSNRMKNMMIISTIALAFANASYAQEVSSSDSRSRRGVQGQLPNCAIRFFGNQGFWLVMDEQRSELLFTFDEVAQKIVALQKQGVCSKLAICAVSRMTDGKYWLTIDRQEADILFSFDDVIQKIMALQKRGVCSRNRL